jgi:hypothetical protein
MRKLCRLIVSARAGAHVQELLLQDFHATAFPGATPSPVPSRQLSSRSLRRSTLHGSTPVLSCLFSPTTSPLPRISSECVTLVDQSFTLESLTKTLLTSLCRVASWSSTALGSTCTRRSSKLLPWRTRSRSTKELLHPTHPPLLRAVLSLTQVPFVDVSAPLTVMPDVRIPT